MKTLIELGGFWREEREMEGRGEVGLLLKRREREKVRVQRRERERKRVGSEHGRDVELFFGAIFAC